MDSDLTIIHVESLIVPQPVDIVFHHLADRFNELPDWNKSFLRIEGPPSFKLKEGTDFEVMLRYPYTAFRKKFDLEITHISKNQRLTYELKKGSFLPIWDYFVEEVTLERTRVTHALMTRQQGNLFHKVRLPMLKDTFHNKLSKDLMNFKRRMEALDQRVYV